MVGRGDNFAPLGASFQQMKGDFVPKNLFAIPKI